MRFFHDSILLRKDRPKMHQEIQKYVDKDHAAACKWSMVSCEWNIPIIDHSQLNIHEKPNSDWNPERSVATEAQSRLKSLHLKKLPQIFTHSFPYLQLLLTLHAF